MNNLERAQDIVQDLVQAGPVDGSHKVNFLVTSVKFNLDEVKLTGHLQGFLAGLLAGILLVVLVVVAA